MGFSTLAIFFTLGNAKLNEQIIFGEILLVSQKYQVPGTGYFFRELFLLTYIVSSCLYIKVQCHDIFDRPLFSSNLSPKSPDSRAKAV
jgi:hypothetical protein